MGVEALHCLPKGAFLGGERHQGTLSSIATQISPGTDQTSPNRPGRDQLVGRDVLPHRVQVLNGRPSRAYGGVQNDPGSVLSGDMGLEQSRKNLRPGRADSDLAGVVNNAHQERVL